MNKPISGIIFILITLAVAIPNVLADDSVTIKEIPGQTSNPFNVLDPSGNTLLAVSNGLVQIYTSNTAPTQPRQGNIWINGQYLTYNDASNTTQTISHNSTEIVQPTMEYTSKSQDNVITNFQKNNVAWTDQTAGACHALSNTTSYVYGNQSQQFTTDGLGTACIFRSPTFSPAYNLQGQIITMWIMMNDTTNISDLRLQISNDGFTHFQNYRLWGNSVNSVNWIIPNMWQRLTFSLTQSDSGGAGAPTYSAINVMQLRITDAGGSHPIRVQIGGIGYYPISNIPLVSFTFDNDDITEYTQAAPALDVWHYSATAFTVTNFIGIDSGHVNLQQLQNLQNQHGWDVSPKTKNNPIETSITSSQLDQELHDAKYYLVQNGFSSANDITAYNHGQFSASVIAEEMKYEKIARTIAEGCPNVACGGLSETYPPADPYRLRVLDVLNTTTVQEAENRLDLACTNHDWVIFEFHQVEPTGPLTASTQVLTSTFGQIVNYTHNKNCFRVLPISSVMSGFTTGNENTTINELGSGQQISTTPSTQVGGIINLRTIAVDPSITATTNSTSLLLNATGVDASPNYWHRARDLSSYGTINKGLVTASSQGQTANVTVAYPFPVGNGFASDQIYFVVGTALANGHCMVGAYSDNGTRFPNALVATGTDQITTSNGIKADTISFNFKSNTLYWLALNCKSSAATYLNGGQSYQGYPEILGYKINANVNQAIEGYQVSQVHPDSGFTLSSTFPSSNSGTTDYANNQIIQGIWVRAK